MWGCVTGFFTYETTKSVVVKSWSVGIINRIIQLLIITYFVGWVFIHEKAYQVTDTGIESTVMTKVKGFGYHQNRVMDVADYVFPPQGAAVFSIMTTVINTENQFQGRCPETSEKFNCTTDAECTKFLYSVVSSGRITGICHKTFNESEGRCEIEGWCPAEDDNVEIQPMLEVENFTIFIKNSVRFPLFNVTKGNLFPTKNSSEIINCTYDPESQPFCPIFRLGDIIHYTGHNKKKLLEKGGEVGINIEWKCDLDRDIQYCVPKYFFTRLDDPVQHKVSKGYNFRFAKYFKTETGTEFRTLHKVFAIRFDVMVTGNAGKFSTIPTLINLVAAFTSIGLGTVFCDIILLNFLKGAAQYKAKKFEEVSEAQIESSPKSSPDSHQSLKPDVKRSPDSGAISLSSFD
ncbi:P2X purinoceptor 3a [Melanotaenia boesemani]|uniref:P2X purinoceptor 3a n=1 Tax=Melanotaenia boesemani TaxID=1250792 RepID=UPI001C05028C|nr:P2X purinoceptor 3a [Melanotaenia boesemani]